MAATTTYPLILTHGGDDRLILKSKGVNKYHCTPEPIDGALFRGSCTCNIPTKEAYAAAESAYNALQNEEVTVSDIMEGVRTQLKSLYNLPPGAEVFLCPSGSDAEYIPLLIAKTLNKGSKIVNIVTCDKEVGSGTLDAAGGRYFSDTVPLPDVNDKAGEKITGKPLEGLENDVETVAIPARDKSLGSINSAADPVQEIVDRCATEGKAVPIVHCVLGSKTGIYEPFPQTNFGKLVSTRDAFVVVDACQGRFWSKDIHDCLDKGAFVLITGSKFFRGPPFSGAVIVPGSIMERLVLTDVDMPSGLRKFITSNDVPPALESWRSALKTDDNTGLALRWVSALTEMSNTLTISDEERDRAMDIWNKFIQQTVSNFSEEMECFEPVDRTSIISIRLKNVAEGSGYLKTDECKKVFEWMTLDLSSKLDDPIAAHRCYIGQPVSITKEDAVVRTALGSDSLRLILSNEKAALAEDAAILAKLSYLVRNYKEIIEKLK